MVTGLSSFLFLRALQPASVLGIHLARGALTESKIQPQEKEDENQSQRDEPKEKHTGPLRCRALMSALD